MSDSATPPVFELRRGASPLIVSIPHAGTFVPPETLARLTPAARALPDTDWLLPELYDFLDALDTTVIAATHSRYVVDLNRPSDDANLYPGQDTTGLCPVDTFAREPLYAPGQAPNPQEIATRVQRYWRPYHDALAGEIARINAAHGRALLWDAHSIAARVPRFFQGVLPEINLGTADGASASRDVETALANVARDSGFTWVLNGRFKGGFITRQYGRPAQRVFAVQLEMSFAAYLDNGTHPPRIDAAKATRVRPVLRALLDAYLASAPKPR